MKSRTLLLALASAAILSGCMGENSTPSVGGGGGGGTSKVIGVWATTSVQNGGTFEQRDRLARPVVNEVFATVANNRHQVNDRIPPTEDKNELANDIRKFMDEAFGANDRSAAHVNTIVAVLVPDVMKADLSQPGPAAYLGVETAGATGGKFGGRKLNDDVVDISLNIVFGTTLSDLGLIPADGKQIPTLTSDNVGPTGHGYKATFPYLGQPR